MRVYDLAFDSVAGLEQRDLRRCTVLILFSKEALTARNKIQQRLRDTAGGVQSATSPMSWAHLKVIGAVSGPGNYPLLFLRIQERCFYRFACGRGKWLPKTEPKVIQESNCSSSHSVQGQCPRCEQ